MRKKTRPESELRKTELPDSTGNKGEGDRKRGKNLRLSYLERASSRGVRECREREDGGRLDGVEPEPEADGEAGPGEGRRGGGDGGAGILDGEGGGRLDDEQRGVGRRREDRSAATAPN